MSGWDELVSTALIGVRRRAVPAAPIPGLGPAAASRSGQADAGVPADSAAVLLDRAALLTAARRAGQPPRHAERVAPAGADPRPEVSAAAGRRLARILAGENIAVLPEWLAAAAARGKRPPAHLLPELMDRARTSSGLRRQVAAAGGPCGRWLAALNPTWSFLLAEGAAQAHGEDYGDTGAARPEQPGRDPAWRLGGPGERRGFLAALRARDPAAARELITDSWDTAAPGERAWFLESLADGLGPADEAQLERALDDRRREVRYIAAGLLARLPGAALGQRMAARGLACLRVEQGPRGPRLRAEPPAQCDAQMRRDGVTAHPPGHAAGPWGRSGRTAQGHGPAAPAGERAWWLEEVLARTPLSTWAERFGMRPGEIIGVRMDEWGQHVVSGWARAAIAQRDRLWAGALIERAVAGKLGWPVPEAGLLAVLPADERTAAAAALVRSATEPRTLRRLLASLPGPWSGELAAAVLAATARPVGRQPAAPAELCGLAGQRLDIALGAPGAPLPGLEGLGPDPPAAVRGMMATLRFRFEMSRELDQ